MRFHNLNSVLLIPSINDRLISKCLMFVEGVPGAILVRRGIDWKFLERCAASGWTMIETGAFHYSRADRKFIRGKYAHAYIFCRDTRGSLAGYDNAVSIAVRVARRITFLDPDGRRRSASRARLASLVLYRQARAWIRDTAISGLLFATFLPLLLMAPFLRARTAWRARFKTLRVLLAKRVHGNQSAPLARALRESGVRAESLSLSGHYFSYEPCDREDNLDRLSDFRRLVRLARHFFRSMVRYDVIIFQNNYESFWVSPILEVWNLPFFAQVFEALVARMLGKRVIFLFRDCSLRKRESQSDRDPHVFCKECTPAYEARFCGSPDVRRRAEFAMRMADSVLVSTPDLLMDARAGATWLPNAIPCSTVSALPRPSNARSPGSPFVILHSSTDPLFKRTSVLQRVVDRLGKRYPIELIVRSSVSHDEMLRLIAGCDIAVDQFSFGSYGNFAIECMAAGKPVIGWIKQEFYPVFVPILSPAIENLENDLERLITSLIEDPELRRSAGERGLKYVHEVHRIEQVSARLRAIIEE